MFLPIIRPASSGEGSSKIPDRGTSHSQRICKIKNFLLAQNSHFPYDLSFCRIFPAQYGKITLSPCFLYHSAINLNAYTSRLPPFACKIRHTSARVPAIPNKIRRATPRGSLHAQPKPCARTVSAVQLNCPHLAGWTNITRPLCCASP